MRLEMASVLALIHVRKTSSPIEIM